jgi:hypothetical protein
VLIDPPRWIIEAQHARFCAKSSSGSVTIAEFLTLSKFGANVSEQQLQEILSLHLGADSYPRILELALLLYINT